MLSRKEWEKKLREEQEATAHVFQEFISTFQESSCAPNKAFVKSGVLYPESGHSINEKSEVYVPKPLLKSNDSMIQNALDCARILKDNNLGKSKKQPKPTSNLELLKEELKIRHSERDEKNKVKDEVSSDYVNYFCEGDPNSTNLFVANLNQNVSENDLMKLFGAYGPLASVKIMWPRGEERFHTTNSGFVAFMSRKDAERALNHFKYKTNMRVGWAKCVEIPTHPIYIPESLLKVYLPPPSTGLPFNAQPMNPSYSIPKNKNEMDELLRNSIVKVTLPLNKKVLMTVHRVVEFVVREGPLFEAYLMTREIDNPDYSFLFNNESPAHIYYRWKLYSILSGEGQKTWSSEPFRMFKGGSIWLPPLAPNYTDGMPDDLFSGQENIYKPKLSNAQTERLVKLIRNLTLSRVSIAEAMAFCLDHSKAWNDVIQILIDSLETSSVDPIKKISRLYLISDVLYNYNLRKIPMNEDPSLLKNLCNVFRTIKTVYNNCKCQYDKEAVESRILKIIRSWDVWHLFPVSFISKLELLILRSDENSVQADEYSSNDELLDGTEHSSNDEPLEAAEYSSNDEPLDGANLIKRSIKQKCGEHDSLNNRKTDSVKVVERFLKSKSKISNIKIEKEGIVLSKKCEQTQQRSPKKSVPRKKQDPSASKVIAEAKIISKWDSDEEDKKASDSTESGRKLSQKQLKKVEYLVKKYQEDIEKGFREIKKGYTLKEQIRKYRKRLIKEMKENMY